MRRNTATAITVVACLTLGLAAGAQTRQAGDEEEQMDTALRKFGYVSGQAFSCHSKDQQAKLERTALNVTTNILRLFGSDRAFFYAAAFGAGASEQVDTKKCPEVIKQAEEMLGRMKVLSSR